MPKQKTNRAARKRFKITGTGKAKRAQSHLRHGMIADSRNSKRKRGERLRCTSCHYSIVQGGHIAVDTKVCFLCHFKGISQGQALGGCPGCHGTPTKIVEKEGFVFSHASYLKLQVPCKQCHIRVAEGDGKVTDAHCYDCHVGRLEKKGDPLSIHRTHVTYNGFDCFRCHEPIRHGEVQLAKTFEVKCDACHKHLHNYQKEMYMGSGAKGSPKHPQDVLGPGVVRRVPHEGGRGPRIGGCVPRGEEAHGRAEQLRRLPREEVRSHA